MLLSRLACRVPRATRRPVLNQREHLPLMRRTLMDAHKRPSHSRMFESPGNKPPTSSFRQKQRPTTDSNAPEPPDTPLHWIMAQRLAMALGLVYVTTEYVADITLCEGPSMAPTIRPYGEIILVDKSCVRKYGIHDGVIGKERERAARQRQKLHQTRNTWHREYISVTDLYKQQQSLTWREAYRHLTSPITVGDVVVAYNPRKPGTVCKRVTGLPGDQVLHTNGSITCIPDGHVWLEGDNPDNSSDSRYYGPLPVALLQGRVVARLWPLRGSTAWMLRGARPRRNKGSSGSTVLPAGYRGEHIVKDLIRAEIDSDDDTISRAD